MVFMLHFCTQVAKDVQLLIYCLQAPKLAFLLTTVHESATPPPPNQLLVVIGSYWPLFPVEPSNSGWLFDASLASCYVSTVTCHTNLFCPLMCRDPFYMVPCAFIF